ncbi:hypothetical protein CkaCkLH20_00452 [Colletotrichum karsti]|uniref:Pheromone receptor n=1 Tax=Colletotrichum karsti TaxID=1095194 RepID=A0A9P6IHI6_9PEZI|nr:uncharacterized protein CkaCkLH20_00452 [Colletotrichum karsti]KAF9882416.1 hypothetical protein CkaCkLH20_00452 [Colletotrichum karsti]
MAEIDPYRQAFELVTGDGRHLQIDVEIVNIVYQENIGICINYGSQIGASFMMLLTIIAMTPSIKLIKVSLWIHILTLIASTIRMTLLAAYFTSNWNNFYSTWTGDYSRITAGDFHRSVATETISLILLILVQISLGIQAWALVNLLPGCWKWFFTGLSFFISTAAVAWRMAFTAIQIEAILLITLPNPDWIRYQSTIIGAVSIFYYCALFNIKLLIHLVKNRGILPTRQGLSAMEVLVITNGLLMMIPAVFASLEWGHWTNFESASVTYTSVVVFLPLGTLVASRISGNTSQAEAQRSGCTFCSSTPLKMGSTSGLFNAYGSTQRGIVTSHVESASSHSHCRNRTDSVDPIDLELRRIEDCEKGIIRVNREVQLYEERV